MLRLVWIMEQRDDLYDELIIDRVIALASYWAEGAEGFASHRSKRAIILHCVAGKGQTADQIFTTENTHTIIPDLMGLTSQKVFAKCSQLELTAVIGGNLGGDGQHWR